MTVTALRTIVLTLDVNDSSTVTTSDDLVDRTMVLYKKLPPNATTNYFLNNVEVCFGAQLGPIIANLMMLGVI